ncbi:uncharacterized protein YggE [Sinorhizobium medicae]
MSSTRIARTVHVAAVAAAFAGAFAAAAAAQDSAAGKDGKGDGKGRPDAVRGRQAVIKVSGEGRSTTAPDMAVLQLSVVKDAKTAREALDANNKAMADVLSALKQAGIAERDLQTSGFSINPQYHYPQNNDGGNRPPELVGYQVVNGVGVRVRDLGQLGEILDKSVSLGVNQGGGIEFTNDKPEAVITEARKAAVADAINKARVLWPRQPASRSAVLSKYRSSPPGLSRSPSSAAWPRNLPPIRFRSRRARMLTTSTST